MDRDALVQRNRRMAEAFHQTPVQHYVRRVLLRLAARIPVRPLRMEEKDRILLIRPDHLGDMLLSTPAIRALRAARPDAEIHMLAGPWSADVIAAFPEVDLVLTLPFPGFSRHHPKENLGSPYKLLLQTARQLRDVGYSSAVIMRPDHWWGAAVAQLAGIPVRIGYALPDVAPFLSETLEHQREHAVLQNMRLVQRWTGSIAPEETILTFQSNAEDAGYVDGYLNEWGISHRRRLICIHPGSGTWVKRWQPEKWARVADTLAEQLKAAAVFTGGDHEVPLVRQIMAEMEADACIMAGDTRVGQLAALYKRATVVLGPDSGPMHLAVAVDTPTVSLFGPADPVEFGPWGSPERHQIVTTDIGCRPCRVLDWGNDQEAFHPCVHEISIGQVLAAAREVTQH